MGSPATRGAAVAESALALRRSHPHAPAGDVLAVCLKGCGLALADFGPALDPRRPFGLLVAEAVDTGMCVDDWKGLLRPGADPVIVNALLQVWHDDVLPAFADRYALRR